MEAFAPVNQEAIEAWNTILFDKFVRFRRVMTVGLGGHGDAALALCPPPRGARVLDLGCGFGDTTLQLAHRVGPSGAVVGMDAAARFIDVARRDAAVAGARNVRYEVADIQTMRIPGPFDYVFARFATMFLTFPVPALRNVRQHMAPGAELCMIVWRRKRDNEWVHRAERVVEGFVKAPEHTDEVTCGPGPFAQSDANVVTDQLVHAGFTDIALRRHDMPMCIGADLDEAVQFATALGPAGEVLRLAAADAERVRPALEAALRAQLAELVRPDGVWASSSTWIITARA